MIASAFHLAGQCTGIAEGCLRALRRSYEVEVRAA